MSDIWTIRTADRQRAARRFCIDREDQCLPWVSGPLTVGLSNKSFSASSSSICRLKSTPQDWRLLYCLGAQIFTFSDRMLHRRAHTSPFGSIESRHSGRHKSAHIRTRGVDRPINFIVILVDFEPALRQEPHSSEYSFAKRRFPIREKYIALFGNAIILREEYRHWLRRSEARA